MTLQETGITQSWRRNRKTAILLAIFLGAWTWIYTYRRDAWKATLGLSIQTSAITGTLIGWIMLRGYFSLISSMDMGVPEQYLTSIFSFIRTILIVVGSVFFFGVQIWAIIDAAKVNEWELTEPKSRNKVASILFAIFLQYWNWLYTYPRDYKKFWLGFALVTVLPTVSYLTWYNPLDFLKQAIGQAPNYSTFQIPWDYQLMSFLLSLPGFVLWIIGIVLAAVRNGDWYKQAGQKAKPAGFRQYT